MFFNRSFKIQANYETALISIEAKKSNFAGSLFFCHYNIHFLVLNSDGDFVLMLLFQCPIRKYCLQLAFYTFCFYFEK